MAEAISRFRTGGESLNNARASSRPIVANVLPLKKRKGARRWKARRCSRISFRLNVCERRSFHACAHGPPVSELIPCCALALSHAPWLTLMTDFQSQFLRNWARACSGELSPSPPAECPPLSDAPADPIAVSSPIICLRGSALARLG